MAARRRIIDVESEQQKRALRAEAARLRRRIDRDLAGLSYETRRLTSWQTYVKRYPLAALGTTFAAGLGISAGLSRTPWKKWLAGKLFSAALAGVKAGLLGELLAAWQRSNQGNPPDEAPLEPMEAVDRG
jgi:hypothetical protein